MHHLVTHGVLVGMTGSGKTGLLMVNVGLPNEGTMDEFRFYSRALTEAEAATLSKTPGVCQ